MITTEQAAEICKRNNLQDSDMRQVVERYIFDRTGQEVDINLYPYDPHDAIGQLYTQRSLSLLNMAFESAAKWYLKP